ncbi:EamA family transporter [Chromobacterium vaccinii]|uniref:EamA family transporter n=1 Tax=Chromobacterium vaccinii TaxID=1108595 RepID=UPI0011C046EE|nr:EamA family transporter [Chromobacterium vaccinii]
MAVLSMCCVQFGAALSQSATQTLGALHATAWRLVFAAALLSLWRRPALPRLPGGAWRVLLGLGLAMAGMLGSFFAAILTLPQGLAVAINLLGPLLLAWRTDKGPRRGWWPSLALARHGERWTADPVGLALALPVAALLALPVCLAGGLPDAGALPRLAGLSLLMPVLPYLLELAALRRMSAASFGVLMSLEPAVAVLAGAALLGQTPGPLQLAGLAMVTAASLGALAES